MKEYVYESKYFKSQVTAVSAFCVVIIVACILNMATTPYAALLCLVIAVSIYTIWNNNIAICTPEVVVMDAEYLEFSAYGKSHKFMLEDVNSLRIREFPRARKMYIRINEPSMLRGRYWVSAKMYSDGEELFHSMLNMEYERHPDSLKATARRTNTEYNAIRDAKQERLAQERKERLAEKLKQKEEIKKRK